jgi:hypothetical protein
MAEVIIIGIYFCLCLKYSKKWIVCSLIFLFPSHLFVKGILEVYWGRTFLFPLWYDIAILVLLLKTLLKHHGKIKYMIPLTVLLVMLLFQFCLSYFSIHSEPDAITTMRLYLHCIVLFIVFSIIDFNKDDYNSLKKAFVYSTLFYCISAIAIYVFFQQEIHVVLGHYEMTSLGVKFKSPSYLIMGFERMFGFIGGPNQFGVYISIVVISLFYMQQGKSKSPSFTGIAFVLSIACIFLSFSRAGWAIIVMTLLFLYLINGKFTHFIAFLSKLFAVVCICVLLIVLLVPESYDIIIASLNGDESSAANRGDIVRNGFIEIENNILGHGLGTGIEENGSPISESSMIICFYELGVFVTIYYYVLIFVISYNIYRKKAVYSNVIFSFVIATIITSIFSMNTFQYPYIYYFWSILGMASNSRNLFILKQNDNGKSYLS